MKFALYGAACYSCGEIVPAKIIVQPEQKGGLETEYLPEHWELDDHLECSCGHQFTRAEEQGVVNAARRRFSR